MGSQLAVVHAARPASGGVENSGHGRFDGRRVIREFTGEKRITTGNPRRRYALWG